MKGAVMKPQNRLLDESLSSNQIVLPNYLAGVVKVWYRKYQELDQLSAKLDTMAGEINRLRGLVEQKIEEIDRLFPISSD